MDVHIQKNNLYVEYDVLLRTNCCFGRTSKSLHHTLTHQLRLLLMFQFVILGCLLCIILVYPFCYSKHFQRSFSHIFRICQYDDLFSNNSGYYASFIWYSMIIVVNFVSTKLFIVVFFVVVARVVLLSYFYNLNESRVLVIVFTMFRWMI